MSFMATDPSTGLRSLDIDNYMAADFQLGPEPALMPPAPTPVIALQQGANSFGHTAKKNFREQVLKELKGVHEMKQYQQFVGRFVASLNLFRNLTDTITVFKDKEEKTALVLGKTGFEAALVKMAKNNLQEDFRAELTR